jgi:hypothetical protein
MPRLRNVAFSGRLDKVITYMMNDKYYYRAVPSGVNQSDGTKIRSNNFGIASRAGKALRNELLKVIPFPKDKSMQSKFSGAIAKWLQLHSLQSLQPAEDMPYIYNFGFNKDTAFQERFRVSIAIHNPDKNSFELDIPAFVPVQSISAPDNTISVDCNITVAGCVLANGISTGNYSTSFSIPYNNNEISAQAITLPFTQAPGNLIVIAAVLTYNISNAGKVEKCIEPFFMPCTIIKAIYK